MRTHLLSDRWSGTVVAAAAAIAATFLWVGTRSWADELEEPSGPIVQIAPTEQEESDPQGERTVPVTPEVDTDAPDAEPANEARSWIGIQGRTIDSPVLRTHLQLAEDLGIVIEQVVPDSPADQAGLRQHDIVIRANGQAVQNMLGLQQVIRESGNKPVQLGVIRLAQEIDVEVTPTEMPAEIRLRAEELDRFGLGGVQPPERLDDLLGGPLGQLRGLDEHLGRMPSGISVRITRDGDGRPQITVRQGDKTWTLDGDDAGELEQLPESIRPWVDRMLTGRDRFGPRDFDRRFDLRQGLDELLPEALENFGGPRRRDAQADDEVLKRMERLERRLEELQQRLEDDDRQ